MGIWMREVARENGSTMAIARLAVVKLPRRRNAGRSSVSAAQSEAINGLDQSFVCCAYRGGYGHKAGLWGKGSSKSGRRGQQPCDNNVVDVRPVLLT